MKMSINTQSKNEVKELLGEYIVTPLKNNISEEMTPIKKDIEGLKGSAEQIKNSSSACQNEIDRLKTKLGQSFIFEEEPFEEITDAIDDNKSDIVAKLNETNKKIDTAKDKIAEKICSDIKNLIEDNKSAVIEKLESADKVLDEKADDIKDDIDKLSKAQTKGFSEIQSSVSDKIEDIVNSQGTIEGAISLINENNKKLQKIESMIGEPIEQKYKALFTAALSVGAINVVGIIIMIILQFLK